VSTALGLVGLLGFILVVIAVAAAITWVVVKLTPKRERGPKQPAA
jgi:flagellar biogenesis protein FliO